MNESLDRVQGTTVQRVQENDLVEILMREDIEYDTILIGERRDERSKI